MPNINEAVSKAVDDAVLDHLSDDGKIDEAGLAKSLAEAMTESMEAMQKKTEALLAMTGAELDHYRTLKGDAAEAWLAKSSEDRQAELKKAQDDDEVLKTEHGVIRKSEVGDSVYAVLKGQQAEIEKQAKDAALEKSKREEAEFAKKAEERYPALPGSPVEKGRVLKALEGVSEEVRKTAEGMLGAANKTVAPNLREVGTTYKSEDEGGEATDALEKLAEEYATKHDITKARAYAKVLETPKGAELYEQTQAVRR